MSKSAGDIFFSIAGATVAGVTVYFLDRHLAQKKSASPVPTPDSLGVDNSFTDAFQQQVSALGNQQGSVQPSISSPAFSPVSSSSSDCGCGSGGTSPTVMSNSPSLAQQSILDSMNNLSSLEANANTVFANRPVTNLGV